jgi:hypothetical protein
MNDIYTLGLFQLILTDMLNWIINWIMFEVSYVRIAVGKRKLKVMIEDSIPCILSHAPILYDVQLQIK